MRGSPGDGDHLYWGCSNIAIGARALGAVRPDVPEAREQKALYERGLVPMEFLDCPGPEESPPVFTSGDWSAGGLEALLCTGGSGGKRTADGVFRRCGLGVALVARSQGGEYRVVAAAFGALGGRRQTVPRAEYTAALVGLRLLSSGRGRPDEATVWTDCASLVRAADRGREGVDVDTANADLLDHFWDAAARFRPVTVQHVPSHTLEAGCDKLVAPPTFP